MKVYFLLTICLIGINSRRRRRKLSKAGMSKQYWREYFKKVDTMTQNYNLTQDKDDLIEHLGEPGTEMDKKYPFYFFQKKYSPKKLNDIEVKKENMEDVREANGHTPLPIREECEEFQKDFNEPCEIYRELRQVKNKIRPNKNIWRSEKRKLKQLKKKKLSKKKNKRKRKYLKGKAAVDYLKRNLFGLGDLAGAVGGAAGGGGGAAQPQAAPQIDDSRIIVHSFAAPPAPQPNLIRAYDGNGQNQLIQARIKIPPRYLKLKIPII